MLATRMEVSPVTSPVATTKSAKRPKLSDELPDVILRMSQREIEAGMICPINTNGMPNYKKLKSFRIC